MDQKLFNAPQPSLPARFPVPSVQSSHLVSGPGVVQVSQQPQPVLQSPPQSTGKVATPGYPVTSTPNQPLSVKAETLSIKTEPGVEPLVDTRALTGMALLSSLWKLVLEPASKAVFDLPNLDSDS